MAKSEWTVEAVDAEPDGTITVKLKESGSYEASEHTPEVGQVLVLKEER